jgi:hypothetical protein
VLSKLKTFSSGLSEVTQEIRKRQKAAEAAFYDKTVGLESANVLCLPAFLSFGHSEFNRLAILQAAVSVRLDSGEMHEDIFPVLAGDKTKALCGVEPLNCSLFHFAFFLMY